MLNAKKGKGKGINTDVKDAYMALDASGQEVTFLPPGSYTAEELLDHASNGKVYYPIAKQIGIV